MRYLTDRKRAEGMGASKTGTEHFWNMQVSAAALAGLIPLFIFVIGPVIGDPLPVVIHHIGQPVRAIIAGLTLFVAMIHFKNGARVMIEDYAHGFMRKALIVAVTNLAYILIAAGLFALVRLSILALAV